MKPVVVIPTFEEAVTLPGILDKILDPETAFDILVVDDNSPDGTGRIADGYASRHERIQVLHRPQKMGLGTADPKRIDHVVKKLG